MHGFSGSLTLRTWVMATYKGKGENYLILLRIPWISHSSNLKTTMVSNTLHSMQPISEGTIDARIFLYDIILSLVDFSLQIHLFFYLVLVFYHTIKINFEFLLIVWSWTSWTKTSFIGDINIHSDSPELPLSERFNNFLKPLDFVTMSCIQANFSSCLGLCHLPWALSG